MRRISYFIIAALFLFLCQYEVFGQADAPFLTEEFPGGLITIRAKSAVYLPNKYQSQEISSAIDNKLYFNLIVDPSNLTPIKIKKLTQLPLVGFIRNTQEFKYNMYIVDYKGQRCLVFPDDVLDNTLLAAKNQMMQDYYAKLLDSLSTKESEFESLLAVKKTEIESELSIIQERKKRTDIVADSLYEIRLSEKIEPMKNKYDHWYSQLPASSKKAADILTLQDMTGLRNPNSASGCDFVLHFTNMSNKTIKYLYWYGSVYNAVNDKVACTVRNTYNFSGKFTGPLEPHMSTWGVWENIIYNWSAAEMRLTKIVINYLDGTSATISGVDIANLYDTPMRYLEDADRVHLRKEVLTEAEQELKKEENIWKDRKRYIDYLDNIGKSNATSETRNYLSDLLRLRSDINKISNRIKYFESQNYLTVK